jgi:hypothetical protein
LLPTNIPNREKIFQITIKYTKLPQNIPSGRKKSIKRPSIIHPNWDFGSENIPSGNPGYGSQALPGGGRQLLVVDGDRDAAKVVMNFGVLDRAKQTNFMQP